MIRLVIKIGFLVFRADFVTRRLFKRYSFKLGSLSTVDQINLIRSMETGWADSEQAQLVKVNLNCFGFLL